MNANRPHRQAGKRSLDGFIPSTPQIDLNSRDNTVRPTPPGGINQSQKLDTISKTDGFQQQSRIEPGSPVTIPKYAPVGMHGTLAHNSKPNKKRKWKKYALRGSLACALLLLVFGGIFAGRLWWLQNKVLKGGSDGALALNSEVKPELLKGEGDGRVNVLILGKGGGNHPGADLTDSILVASIDPIAKEASLLSIPRDLWVNVPDLWSMKINAVYSTAKQKAFAENENDAAGAESAGQTALSQVIEQYIGIPIHYYTMVDFTAFQQAIDAVGGVQVDVKEPLYDYNIAWENGGSSLIAEQGAQSFNGQKALLYARSRYTSSDFARGQRQRELVVALKDKVLQLGTFSNPLTVSKLISAVGDNVTTNISLNEIMRMYEIGKDIPSTSIASLGFTDEPNVLVKTANINDQSVVIPRRGVDDYSEIQSFVRNSLRDGFLKSENATVIVLNGTGIEGMATQRSEELKSYGYNVVTVDNAPTSDYATTELIDFTNGVKKYTKRYLEQRLKVQAQATSVGIDPTIYPADFVIIIGNNEATSTAP